MFAARKMMMAGGIRGIRVLNTAMSDTTGASVSCGIPSGGRSGCTLVAVVYSRISSQLTFSTPSGWTKTEGTSGYQYAVYTRPWVAGASFAVTISHPSGVGTVRITTVMYLVNAPLAVGNVGTSVTASSAGTLTVPSVNAASTAAWLMCLTWWSKETPAPLPLDSAVARVPDSLTQINLYSTWTAVGCRETGSGPTGAIEWSGGISFVDKAYGVILTFNKV